MKPRTRRGLAAATTTALTLATIATFGTAGAAPTTVASQGFEANATGFSSWMGDSSVARTTTGARTGKGALAITAKSGASVKWGLSGSAFVAGRSYTFTAYGKNTSTTTGSTWGIVQFYDAGWRLVGQTMLATATLTPKGWSTITGTFTAPAGAAYAQLGLSGPRITWTMDDAKIVDNSTGATVATPAPTTTTQAPTTTTQAPTTTTTQAPTTTTTQAPTTTTTQPPAPPLTGTRDARLWPFSVNSPWNTPIGSGAVLESATSPRTNAFRTWPVTTWMNSSNYSVPVYVATWSDPVVAMQTDWEGVKYARIPAAAVPAAGTDSNMAIIQPDGTTWDVWTAKWVVPGVSMRVGRAEVSNVTGSGLGPQAGIRASGLSSLGGLIRRWEVDPTDPGYTDGVIRHAVAISVPGNMLLFSGGASGYDANGYGTARGYVWPATEQDWGSESIYKGPVPMGSLLTIPKSVNLANLGLSPAAYKIAKAVQDYGAYIVDMSGPSGSVTFYAEPTLASSSWYSEVIGSNWTARDLGTIRSNMVVVANNGPTSVGGGGTPLATVAPAIG